MKPRIVESLPPSIDRRVQQAPALIVLLDSPLVQVGKVLERIAFQRERGGENEHAMRREEFPDILERPRDRRHDVLEYVACNDELEAAVHRVGDVEDVEPRTAMEIGVPIIERSRERPRIHAGIGQAEAANAAIPVDVDEQVVRTEHFARHEATDGAKPDRRAANAARRRFTIDPGGADAIRVSAQVASKADDGRRIFRSDRRLLANQRRTVAGGVAPERRGQRGDLRCGATQRAACGGG